ncbi:MAG: ROK family transcriptional regulator [Devosia sp.]
MALRGTNQEFGRPYNRRIVLEAIRANGPTTRGRIAETIGLTVQTVSTIIRELEEQGYILAEKEEPRGRGLPPTTLRLNPEGGYAIGVHVTPVGIDAGLVDLAGDVIATTHRDALHTTPDEAFTLIRAMVGELRKQRPHVRMLGAGLALPGPFEVDSMSFVGPTTMAGWANVALRERLAEVSGMPAFIETDMAAAAHGERLYGRGAEFSDFYYLFFGVGLGGVMVHDGHALRGAWGNAGEIGHVPVVPDGEPCPCGNAGCLERYLSLDAFGRRGLGEAEWVASIRPQLRTAITMIENLYDPATIILGGMLPDSLAHHLADAAANLPNSVAARRDRKAPRLMLSDGGANAVLRGAAALAVSGALSPRFGQMFTPGREPKGLAA